MHKILFIFVLIFVLTSLFAEEVAVKKYPLKAAALSCLIPGGGQFYNGKIMKSGLIFAVEGGLIGLAAYHHLEAEKYYDKYRISSFESDYHEYVKYYEKRQSDFFWIGMVIFLSAIDAYIDAHLFDFEEKKNKIHLKFEDNTFSLVYNF
jgi:TM2 domain-containing membrane protein YozV